MYGRRYHSHDVLSQNGCTQQQQQQQLMFRGQIEIKVCWRSSNRSRFPTRSHWRILQIYHQSKIMFWTPAGVRKWCRNTSVGSQHCGRSFWSHKNIHKFIIPLRNPPRYERRTDRYLELVIINIRSRFKIFFSFIDEQKLCSIISEWVATLQTFQIVHQLNIFFSIEISLKENQQVKVSSPRPDHLPRQKWTNQ